MDPSPPDWPVETKKGVPYQKGKDVIPAGKYGQVGELTAEQAHPREKVKSQRSENRQTTETQERNKYVQNHPDEDQ